MGLETAVSLTFDRLVHAGVINMTRMVALLSTNPARLLNIPGGTLAEGSLADITILAPDMAVKVAAASMKTRSKNMPFEGWELRGGVAATIVGGRTLFLNPDAGFTV